MQLTPQQKEFFFKEAFELHFERVVAYIYGYCKDWEMARNIAQDTYVTFWENIEKVDSTKTALPYLFFISKNKTLNILKRDMVREKYSSYTHRRDLEISYRALESSTMDAVHVSEIERLISKSVEQMNDKVRETFCLSRFRNLKNEEVAQELDISIKTVEYRMAAALRILKRNLKDFIHLLLLFSWVLKIKLF